MAKFGQVESFVMEGMDQLRREWELRHDYSGGKPSRFRRTRAGVGTVPHHADYHYRLEIEWFRGMEFFRDFDRNDPVVGQGVTRCVDNVLQKQGITPDPATPDSGVNSALKERWSDWHRDPDQVDIQGEATFHQLERDILRAALVDGDSIPLGTRDGQIEVMEAHRCRTPARTRRNVVHGVELDDVRKRVNFWFAGEDVNPFAGEDVNPLSVGLKIGDMRNVPPRFYDKATRRWFRQVFHVYRRRRVSQTRGVSALNPICDIAGMFDDLNFATLVKAQVASCFAILREYSAVAPPVPGGHGTMGSSGTENLQDGTQRILEGVAPGVIVDGKPGQTLKGFSPNIPNAEFFPHSALLLTFMAMNLNLPLTVLLLDPERAGNFSSLRGVMEQAKLGFMAMQRWLIEKFHQPVWRWKARQWADEDRSLFEAMLKLGPAFFACKWRPPRHPYIEPVTDRAAALLGSRNLLASPRDTAAENGFEWEEIVKESVDDNALAIVAAIEKANEINKRYPTAGVTWRDVLSLPTPDRVNVSLSATTVPSGSAPASKKSTNNGQGA